MSPVEKNRSLPMLVDTHAHMEMLRNVDEAIARAEAAGVAAIVAVGSNPESNLKVRGLSVRYAGYVHPAYGLHPWDLPQYRREGLEFLHKHLGDCIALGEAGLDYWIKVDKAVQEAVFKEILSLALSVEKPVLIHSRGAWQEALEAVEASGVKATIFHWFSGPTETLKRLVDEGFLISASPAAVYSKAHRAAIQLAPLESIVLETDSPVRYSGVESEPAHLVKSLKAVAELKGLSQEAVAEKTTENAVKLLRMKLQV